MSEQDDAVRRENAHTDDHPEIEFVVKVKRPGLRWRAGCVLVLLIWLAVMMLPLGLIVLAVEGNITIAHGGDIPNPHEHPRMRLNLIMEIDFRGISVTRSALIHNGENDLCVQTAVNFVLWEGDGEPATFCDCYVRPEPDANWERVSTTTAACD
jgi:hypothetical protein